MNRRPASLWALCALVVLLCASRTAAAFVDSNQFFDPPGSAHVATTSASAEGIYFTGAPRWSSLPCASCHVGGAGAIRLRLGADDPTLFSSGYSPGQTYGFEIELLGETRGLGLDGPSTCTEIRSRSDHYSYVPCNNNNFAAEIDGDSAPAGTWCAAAPVAGVCPPPNPFADESQVAPGGDAVFGARSHDASMPKTVLRNGPTRWHFWWTAPAAGTGALTLYAALVDGDGGDGTENDDQDPVGDDTVAAAIPIVEAGATLPPQAGGGCRVAGGKDGRPLFVLGIGFVLAVLGRRHRGRKRFS